MVPGGGYKKRCFQRVFKGLCPLTTPKSASRNASIMDLMMFSKSHYTFVARVSRSAASSSDAPIITPARNPRRHALWVSASVDSVAVAGAAIWRGSGSLSLGSGSAAASGAAENSLVSRSCPLTSVSGVSDIFEGPYLADMIRARESLITGRRTSPSGRSIRTTTILVRRISALRAPSFILPSATTQQRLTYWDQTGPVGRNLA